MDNQVMMAVKSVKKNQSALCTAQKMADAIVNRFYEKGEVDAATLYAECNIMATALDAAMKMLKGDEPIMVNGIGERKNFVREELDKYIEKEPIISGVKFTKKCASATYQFEGIKEYDLLYEAKVMAVEDLKALKNRLKKLGQVPMTPGAETFAATLPK